MIYQFSVCFLNYNDENNNNPFWALCGKIGPWALVLNYPIAFVPGSARCSSALCLFYLYSKIDMTLSKLDILIRRRYTDATEETGYKEKWHKIPETMKRLIRSDGKNKTCVPYNALRIFPPVYHVHKLTIVTFNAVALY